MHGVTKVTPIQFIDGNKLKSYRTGLTNHTRPISHDIVPLVINGLGGRHTNRQTNTHKHTDTPTKMISKYQACVAKGLKTLEDMQAL